MAGPLVEVPVGIADSSVEQEPVDTADSSEEEEPVDTRQR